MVNGQGSWSLGLHWQTTIVTSPPLEIALNLGVNQAHEILQAHSCLPFATDRHQVTPCTELVPSSAIVASASLSPEKKGLLLHMPAHDLVGSFLSVIPPLELKGKCLDGERCAQPAFSAAAPKKPTLHQHPNAQSSVARLHRTLFLKIRQEPTVPTTAPGLNEATEACEPKPGPTEV